MQTKPSTRVNDPLTVVIADLELGGKAVARHDGRVAFVDRGLPGTDFGPSLSVAFAVLGPVAAFAFVGLLVFMAALLACVPLFGIVVFASSSADALKKAEGEKKLALEEIRAQVAELAIGAAAKIVSSSLTPEAQRKLVDEFLDSVPKAAGL